MRQSPLKDQLTAAKRLLLHCTTPGISRKADSELLAVGQFRDVALFTAPALMPDPLFDRPLIATVGTLVGSSWCACAPSWSWSGEAACHFPVSSCGWSKESAGPGPRSLRSFGP